MLGTLKNVGMGDPILATVQNHIIDTVNRVNTASHNGKSAFGSFSNYAQGVILNALIDDSSSDTEYEIGEPVIITSYLPIDGTDPIIGCDQPLAVAVARKTSSNVSSWDVAVVVERVTANGSGKVCIAGACIARVTRETTDPEVQTQGGELCGLAVVGEDTFAIAGEGGDIDILWEETPEDTDQKDRWAYVRIPSRSAMADGFLFKNVSGVTMPRYAMAESTGSQDSGWDEEIILELEKPSADNMTAALFMVPRETPDQGYGICYPATSTKRNSKVGLTTSPTDLQTETVGTEADSWYLTAGNTGFKADVVKAVAGLSVPEVAYIHPFRDSSEKCYRIRTGQAASVSQAISSNSIAVYSSWIPLNYPINPAQTIGGGSSLVPLLFSYYTQRHQVSDTVRSVFLSIQNNNAAWEMYPSMEVIWEFQDSLGNTISPIAQGLSISSNSPALPIGRTIRVSGNLSGSINLQPDTVLVNYRLKILVYSLNTVEDPPSATVSAGTIDGIPPRGMFYFYHRETTPDFPDATL